MIDYLKIMVQDTELIKRIYKHDSLLWYEKNEKLSMFDHETIQAKETKIYKEILFCFYDGKLEILFRPHYYFNDNLHNANDFKVLDSICVLKEFIYHFGLIEYTNELKIINLEYGVNAESPIKVKDLITFLAYHKRNQFINSSGLKYSKYAGSFNHKGNLNSYLIIKFYAKSVQFPEYTKGEVFRFEIKSKRSVYIRKLGVRSLKDLLQVETYEKLGKSILREFSEVLILDNSNIGKHLNREQQKRFNLFLNPIFWYDKLQKNRNTFSNNKRSYLKLLNKTKSNIHNVIKSTMVNKLKQLEGCADFTPPKEDNSDLKGCADFSVYIVKICTRHYSQKLNNRSNIKNILCKPSKVTFWSALSSELKPITKTVSLRAV